MVECINRVQHVVAHLSVRVGCFGCFSSRIISEPTFPALPSQSATPWEAVKAMNIEAAVLMVFADRLEFKFTLSHCFPFNALGGGDGGLFKSLKRAYAVTPVA
tara:strand:- start:198 stop:506 length:309 start_codon:yes stop_codon:yes gene_type:complete